MVFSLFSAAVKDADSTAAAFFFCPFCPFFPFDSEGDATAATFFPPCFFTLDLDRDPIFFCDKGVPAEAAACCGFCTVWFHVCMATALNQGDAAELQACAVLISATHKGDQ